MLFIFKHLFEFQSSCQPQMPWWQFTVVGGDPVPRCEILHLLWASVSLYKGMCFFFEKYCPYLQRKRPQSNSQKNLTRVREREMIKPKI